MTRTFCYKEVTAKNKEIYDLVLNANRSAIAKIKPGVPLCELDKTARDIITEAGYGEPGIYLPGDTGVRIEDLVLVTEDGVEVLNSYTKELQVIE